MIQKKYGRIINISSMWGTYGASMEVAYSAAKGGVNTFTKALAKELAPSNISVNAITCGVIDTDMNKCFSEEETQALIDEIPAGRMAATSEVAKTVSSIIEAPIYMTGQIIGLDGGIY
jgi:3-oxoacyl-[acyl-carrier protein] reductase